MATEKVYPNTALPERAATHIAEIMCDAILARGHCYCALSGGSSPKPMLQALAKTELAATELDWSKVTLLLVDERITDDPESQNQTIIHKFIQHIAPPRPAFHLLLPDTGSLAPTELLATANETTKDLPEQLDIVVLGMGLDGHTASLFPDSADYNTGMTSADRYVLVQPGQAPHQRLSMSYHWIQQARNLILYIPGQDKLDCYHRIVGSENTCSPIRTLSTDAPRLTVYSSKE